MTRGFTSKTNLSKDWNDKPKNEIPTVAVPANEDGVKQLTSEVEMKVADTKYEESERLNTLHTPDSVCDLLNAVT